MAMLSNKAKRLARAAARQFVSTEGGGTLKSRRKLTSFPYTCGSLVSFRKPWHPWRGVSVDGGSLALVMNGPYPGHGGAYYVDAVVAGRLIENIPAKLLILQCMEAD